LHCNFYPQTGNFLNLPVRCFLSVCTLLLLVFSGTNFAHGQTAAPLPLPDESELLNPAWARPAYVPAATPYASRTRYLLALDVDYPNGKITGQARILFVNNTPDVLSKAVFRLYPNHPIPATYGQSFSKPRMTIQALRLNGAEIPIQLRDNYKTVLDVPFADSLPVGGKAEILVNYTVQLAAPSDILDVREAFPLQAVYESGKGWREDIMTKSLDYVFSETALYAVTLRAPNNVALYATGAITRTEADANRVIYHITTGPVRDFVFVLTKGWGFVRGNGAPIPLDIRFKGTVGVAEEVADLAVKSFNYYDQTFGPYLYSHLTLLALVYPSGGEEYPTLLFIDTSRDTPYRRFIVAHEVAHQWFYGIAGNDVARHAWLDESLAQISMYLFYLDTYGKDVAEREWANILTWANRLKGDARPIDTPVESFADFSEYMVHTYGLGSLFLRELGEKMGWNRFKAGLSEYYQNASLRVGTPAMFFEAMQGQAPELDLKPLFCQQLGTNCN
jgi:hypothetical protein